MDGDGSLLYTLVFLFVVFALPFAMMVLSEPRAPRVRRPGQPLTAAEIRSRAFWRLHAIESRWSEFDGDLIAALRYPVIADHSEPTIARYYDALNHARTLESRTGVRTRDREACVLFAESVSRVDEAWREARDTAVQVGLSRLDPSSRAAVERVIDLIKFADSTDNPDAEREAAGDRVREQVAELTAAGVVRLTGYAEYELECEVGNLHPLGAFTGF